MALVWTRRKRSLTDFDAVLDEDSTFHIRWNADAPESRRWSLSLETLSIEMDCFLNVHPDLESAKRAADDHLVDHDRVPPRHTERKLF